MFRKDARWNHFTVPTSRFSMPSRCLDRLDNSRILQNSLLIDDSIQSFRMFRPSENKWWTSFGWSTLFVWLYLRPMHCLIRFNKNSVGRSNIYIRDIIQIKICSYASSQINSSSIKKIQLAVCMLKDEFYSKMGKHSFLLYSLYYIRACVNPVLSGYDILIFGIEEFVEFWIFL